MMRFIGMVRKEKKFVSILSLGERIKLTRVFVWQAVRLVCSSYVSKRIDRAGGIRGEGKCLRAMLLLTPSCYWVVSSCLRPVFCSTSITASS